MSSGTTKGAWQKLEGELEPAKDDCERSLLGAVRAQQAPDTPVPALSCGQLLRSLRKVAMPFFQDPVSRCKAWCLSSGVVLLTLSFTGMMVLISSTVKDYNQALEEKNKANFWQAFNSFLLIVAICIPLLIAAEWIRGCLALEWRRHMTERLLGGYISDSQAYYRLKVGDNAVDNPDQRIAQDVAEFTKLIIDLVTGMFGSLATVLAMSGVLLHISQRLFLFLIVFSLSLTFIAGVVFGRPLVQVQQKVLSKEATLRFGLVRIREHAESIAFYQGATFERLRSGQVFGDVVSVLYEQLCLMCTFHGLNTTCSIAAPLLPPLILAPQYFNGDIEFGEIGQAGMVFGTLLGSMTTIMSRLDAISNLSAQALRIQELWDELARMDAERRQDSVGTGSPDLELGLGAGGTISLLELPAESDGACLELQKVSLQAPCSTERLFQEVSLELNEGESLIVSGESGIGKSSLLRAIGGLWAQGRGCIKRCSSKECFFLPQEPYMCLGSLRDNVLYPSQLEQLNGENREAGTCMRDDEIKEALERVKLGHLYARYGLDAVVDFDGVLSGGEKQRLSFARLLLRPTPLRLAVLDEATSALDVENEDRIYRLLRKHVQCFVSVGHRSNLDKFHSHKLNLTRHAASPGCITVSRIPSGVDAN